MARCYLKEIRQVYPTGPIYLLGHSFGGLIAYEMVRQIEHNDESLGLLAIIDTKTPRLAKIRPTIGNFLLALVHNLWYVPGNERLMYLIKTVEWFQKKRKLASDREYAEHLKQKNANLRMFNVLQPNYKAQETYEPALYQGKMIIFRAIIQSPRSFREKTLGWQSLVEGGIDVYAIPGNHLSVMEEPNVGYLAKILASYLERLEKKEMVSVR